MTNEERNEYVKYRLESARKTFLAAQVLAERDLWNSAVNRLYYALFYAVNALLVLNHIQTKSHSSTKSQFSLHFIKTGKIALEYGRLFAELFDWRQKGDYENIIDFTHESVNPLFEPVNNLINLIEEMVLRQME